MSETFEKLEQQKAAKTDKPEGAVYTTDEVSLDSLSTVAVGDQVKYVRPNLDGTEDVIEKFQIFTGKLDEKQSSMNGNSEYCKNSCVLTYASKNEDGIQNREYISGARQFVQSDGTLSDISFWYEGAESQMSDLWELVAKAKGKEPKDLSPREFVTFLNSQPKVKIEGKSYKNFNAAPGQPAKVTKNMIGVFLE